MSIVRRLFFYFVSLITLGILAAGIQMLLYLFFNIAFTVNTIYFPSGLIQQRLSLGLAMVVIGGPLWFFFWRSIQHQVGRNPAEIGSAIRKGFLNLILAVTALLALYSASDVFRWLIAGSPRSENASGSLATLVVVAAIWYFHWRISEKEGQPSRASKTLRRWHVYILSGWSLVLLAAGFVELVYAIAVYFPVNDTAIFRGPFWTDSIRTHITLIILGGLWWYFYWFRASRGDSDSTLRRVYIYLLAIVGGSIAGLVAIVFTLRNTFLFALGNINESGNHYFLFLGWTIPLIVVAAVIVAFHQVVAQAESAQSPERHLSSRRVHLYILSFLGLGTLVAGTTILIGVLLNLAANNINAPVFIQSDWWKTQLALGLALLLVAIPLWTYFWLKVVHLAAKGGVDEWKARSRRIYLYAIIGISIIALTADLVNIVYQILNGAFTSRFGVNILRDSIWSIQSLVVAAPVLIYHWRVFRNDQQRGAEIAISSKTVTIMIDEKAMDLVSRLENKLGTKVHVLQSSGPPEETPSFSDEELDKWTSDIQASPSSQVLVIIRDGKVWILPYQEK